MAIRGFELGTETDRMFADAEQKRAEREVGKTQFQEVVDASDTKPMTAEEFAYAGASMAPVTGDIIAYKEAPEDFERAYELMQKGYKEKDLVNLGLGTAFAGLVALGLVPGIGFISRMGKNAAKDTVKNLIEDGNLKDAADIMVKSSKTFQDKALVNKQSEAQLKKLADARIKFMNMSYREKKRAIKRLNRPENITVYHGSKGMQDKLASYKDYPEGTTSLDATRKDMLVSQGFQPYGNTEEGIAKSRGVFKEARGLTAGDGFHAEIRDSRLLSTSRDPNVSMSPSFTNPDTIKNADNNIISGPIIENLIYAEIPYEKMGNMKPDDYMDLTNSLASNSSVRKFLTEKYFSKTNKNEFGATMLPKSGHVEAELAVAFPEYFNPKSISDLDPSKADYSTNIVPDKRGVLKSEAELFEGKDIGKLDTPEKVKAAKIAFEKADILFERIGSGKGSDFDKAIFPTQNKIPKEEAIIYRNKAYDNVKDALTSMSELAKYTSEFGARGSYDKFLQRIQSYSYEFDKLADKFPEGSEKYNNLKILSTIVDFGFYDGPLGMSNKRKGFSAKKALDNISNKMKKKEIGTGLTANKQVKEFLTEDQNLMSPKGRRIEGMTSLDKTYKKLKPREAKEMILELTSRFNRGGLVKQKGLMARN